MRLLLLFSSFAAVLFAQGLALPAQPKGTRIRYDNFAVFKIKTHNAKQRALIEDWANNEQENFRLWHEADSELHLMVSPKALEKFHKATKYAGLKATQMIKNVQSLIDEEQIPTTRDAADNAFGWTKYYPLAKIYAWLDEILAAHANVAEGFVIGKSYEGRDIRGIKISHKTGNPGIFIESNIHAREWITSATSTYFINQLLTSKDAEIRSLAENYDWYFVPVLNVDGFAYTHEKDRLWRKTRQPVATSKCIGADPNRNYDSFWMANNGASNNPCSETYAGPQAFSEPEIKAMSNFVLANKQKINIMLAFHSYSQVLLSPYGHTKEEFPPNYDDLQKVAGAYATAVQKLPYKTEYDYGSTASVLYVASGATSDWAYNEADIKISYTVEMRDTGRFGFVLPPIQIIPNCEETIAGLIAMIKQADSLGYMKLKSQ